MTRPKHERIQELLTDAFWSDPMLGINSPERMVLVIERLIRLFNEQPRADDCDGSLQWAGQWLAQRLEEDLADPP